MTAIIILLSYYAKQNFRFGWKKSSTTTYVAKCYQHAVSACKGVGCFVKNSTNASEHLTKQHITVKDIEIKPAGLVYTTNTDSILRSKTITSKNDIVSESTSSKPKSEWRVSLKNFKRSSVKIDSNKGDCESSKTSGIVCDDEIPQVSVKMMTRNFGVPLSKV